MKQFYLGVIACTLSVVLLYPAFAVSQTNTGSLAGMVIDVMGIAIPKSGANGSGRLSLPGFHNSENYG